MNVFALIYHPGLSFLSCSVPFFFPLLHVILPQVESGIHIQLLPVTLNTAMPTDTFLLKRFTRFPLKFPRNNWEPKLIGAWKKTKTEVWPFLFQRFAPYTYCICIRPAKKCPEENLNKRDQIDPIAN